jgi:hypothetical protein
MPGQLVELNKQAWLLLTHYNVSQLHRLHVGAMVSKSLFKLSTEFAVGVIRSIMVIAWPDPWYQCSAVRHVHIMVLDSAGEKELLLGACFRSHGRVVLFSDLNVTWVSIHSNKSCEGHLAEHVVFFLFLWSILRFLMVAQYWESICICGAHFWRGPLLSRIPSSSSYLREDMLISTVLFLACFFHMFNLVKNVDVVELQWRCS